VNFYSKVLLYTSSWINYALLNLGTEGTFDAAEPHLLAAGKRDSARLLAQMLVDWATEGGKPGNFALRGTLSSVQGCIHPPLCESLMEGLRQILGKW